MDRFDNIWKERLKEPESPALDWCSPSDQVWTAVSKEVFPPKDRRVFAWWWVGLGLALIGAIMFVYFMAAGSALTTDAEKSRSISQQEVVASSSSTVKESSRSKETLNNEVAAAATDIATNEEKKDQTPIEAENSVNESESVSGKDGRAIQATAIQATAISEAPEKLVSNADSRTQENPSVQETSYSTIAYNASLSSNDDLVLNSVVNSGNDIDNNALINSKSTSPLIEESVKNTVLEQSSDDLSFLSTLDAGILNSENITELHPFVEKQIEIVNNNAYSLRLSSGVFEWKHKISEAFTNDLSAFKFNYEDSYGVFIRLDMQKSVSPLFAFGFGVELDRVKIESGHNSLLDYLLDDEVGGLKVNDYQLDLATPYGLMPASFKFFRDDALAADANLLVDFSNEHLIHNLRAPITFTLTPFRRLKKWQFGLDAGLGFNYIAQLSNRAQSIVTNHSQIHLQDASVNLSDQDIKRFHLDIFGAAFVERRINDGWALRTYYERNWGQTKLFELGAYHTRIDRCYFGVGLSKIFK